MTLSTSKSVNIDMAVVVLVVGCISGQKVETGIGGTGIGGGAMTIDELN